MKNDDLFFPQAIYLKHLTIVEGIHFTRREIDVMACLLHARSTGKIASLLNVASTTVTTHIQNIMEKLKCNSRESIVDFVERSYVIDIIKKYYVCLLIYSTFEKSLKACSKVINKSPPPPLVVYCKDQQAQSILAYYLPIHLKLAGIEAEIQLQKLNLPYNQTENKKHQKSTQDTQVPQKVLIIILKEEDDNGKNILKRSNKSSFSSIFIEFSNQKSYYFSVFEILKKISPKVNFEAIVSLFTRTCETLERSHKILPIEISLSPPSPAKTEIDGEGGRIRKKTKYWEKYGKRINNKIVGFFHPVSLSVKKGKLFLSAYIFAFLFLGLIGIGFLLFQKAQENKQGQSPIVLSQPSIRSDLVIPKESVLLIRPDLITQIEDKFKLSKNVQVVALVGQGVLGRRY